MSPSRLIAHFVIAGAVVGLNEAVVQSIHGPLHPLAAMAMNSVAAVLIGLVMAIATVLVALGAKKLPALDTRLASIREKAQGRHPSPSSAYATVLATLLLLMIYGAGLYAALLRAWLLQDKLFAIQLATVFSIGLVVACIVGFFPLRAALWRLLKRSNRPPERVVPVTITLIGIPTVSALTWFSMANRELLGDLLTRALWFGTLLIAAASVASIVFLLSRRNFFGDRSYTGLCFGVFVVLVVSTLLSFEFSKPIGAMAQLRGGVGGRLGLSLVHALSDVDRDGFSSLMSGGDCAAFDADRNPGAPDVPGNGEDENCDGRDEADIQVSQLEAFLSVAPPVPVKPYNVVWLIIDSARSDQIGAYTKGLKTSPNIDQFARESLVFERAFSQSSRTLYSLSSMFSGKNPMGIPWSRSKGYPQAASKLITLPETLTTAGYATGLVLPGNVKKYYTGLQQGFSTVESSYLDDDWSKWSFEGAPVANLRGLEFMEKAQAEAKPFFLVVHYIEPHVPYQRHGDGYRSFGRGPMANYKGELAYVDRQVQGIFDYLRRKGTLWKDTIVIVTADHGEEFGEHGGKHHGRTCHRESTQVPLIIRIPGIEARRIATPVALIDIVPMLVELIGVPKNPNDLDGQSLLVPLFEPESTSKNRPIFCATANKGTRTYLQTSVRAGDFLLVKEVWDGVRTLYNTASDSSEPVDQRSSAQVLRLLESHLQHAATEDIEAGW